MSFADIPSRSNGPAITATWFNSIRTAGIALESFLGTITGLTTFTIVNNQVAAADVTGLLLNSTNVKMAVIDYRIRRRTSGGGADERVQGGSMVALYKQTAATWSLTPGPQSGDDAGVEFSITNAGQVQYVSDNQSGTPDESILKYTVRALA
jgi:hypothetical protein